MASFAATHPLATGAAAGAIGTMALNASTYLDVVFRGRAPSQVPAETVRVAATSAGVEEIASDEPAAQHRRTGLGALFGYATGVATGVAYAVVRPRLRSLPTPVAGLGAGAAAMLVADAGAVAAGVTDPRRWRAQDWLADILPHAIFGIALAATFDRLR